MRAFISQAVVRSAGAALTCAALLTARPALASELSITTGDVDRTAGARVTADVTWKNAWRNTRNHDAVWVFVKYRGNASAVWRHARVQSITAQSSDTPLTCTASADRVGAFCAVASPYRGDVTSRITIELDTARMSIADRRASSLDVKVLGLEMVYVPSGPFTIGDVDTAAIAQAAFYRSDANGNYAGTMRITSEAAIDVAPRNGALYYRSVNQYQGDRLGPIPAEFPKGTRAFYAMKYEPTQGQYATFLNMISSEASFVRANIGGRTYAVNRGTVRVADGQYVADKPQRPANMLGWDDGIAFADWTGLRPMTEFEFTKAARGPAVPLAGDYPWGTSDKSRLARRLLADGDLATTGAADESQLGDNTRDVFGASYWWVMDLAGSVWEKVITVGHPAGRAFRGTHGDGELQSYGRANVADWPAGDFEAGGYGYRGGGYYEWSTEQARDPEVRLLNPHSPVSWRPYGSWGGGPRGVAYGFRAVRTADE